MNCHEESCFLIWSIPFVNLNFIGYLVLYASYT